MVAIDFGITVRPSPQGGTLPEMTRVNERILQAAVAHDLTCWVIDHFQSDTDPILECMAFLAYQAGAHPGLRWGTLVLGQGYRNPALTAKMAATLQFLTGGRFILGLGAGDAEREHRAYGYPFPEPRVRVAQLQEAAAIIRAMWQGGPATYSGEHYQIQDAHSLPAPQPPAALMIGGGGERLTLRVVAEHADWWNCDYYSPPEYARKLDVLRSHCRAIGRDPDQIVPTCYMGVTVSHDPAKLVRRRSMSHRGEVHVISGNPDEVTEQIAAFAAVGVRHMQLNFLDFPSTDSLELFFSDVYPRFSGVERPSTPRVTEPAPRPHTESSTPQTRQGT
jgi:alkanesulfonate monooxygenase SsuD/methylene tetrahydromethanopterin reductase-like flavin-dependent oxidoreductase (luciferase family)